MCVYALLPPLPSFSFFFYSFRESRPLAAIGQYFFANLPLCLLLPLQKKEIFSVIITFLLFPLSRHRQETKKKVFRTHAEQKDLHTLTFYYYVCTT